MSNSYEAIQLSLTLVGGHRVQAWLDERIGVFEQLLQVFAGSTCGAGQEAFPSVFAFPTAGGMGTVFIRTADLLAIEVDRVVQPVGPSQTQQQLGSFIIQSNVLATDTVDALMRYVLARKDDFRPSTIADTISGETTIQPTHRISDVLYDLLPFQYLFEDKIRMALPSVQAALGGESFPLGRLECQITASRGGAFFNRHRDDSGKSNAGRRISYVYYFNTEPRLFTGGELILYPPDQAPIRIEPTHNSMVFFPSGIDHEVTPVHCPDPALQQARLTVNGWVHSAS